MYHPSIHDQRNRAKIVRTTILFGFSNNLYRYFFLFYSKLTFIFLLFAFYLSLSIYSSQMFLPSSCPSIHSSNLYFVWLFVPLDTMISVFIFLPATANVLILGFLLSLLFPLTFGSQPLLLGLDSRFLNGISFLTGVIKTMKM